MKNAHLVWRLGNDEQNVYNIKCNIKYEKSLKDPLFLMKEHFFNARYILKT